MLVTMTFPQRRVRPRGANDRIDPREHDDRLGPGVGELVRDLARGVQRVAGHDHPADPQRRVERDEELRAVRQHDRHTVAGTHAERPESGGEAHDIAVQLAVAAPAAEEDRGRRIGVALRGIVQQLVERGIRILQLRRHPGVVVARPRPVGPRPRLRPHRDPLRHRRLHFRTFPISL